MRTHTLELNKLTSSQIVGYLISTGWYKDGQIGEIASIWHKDQDSELEILVPLINTLKDYKDRINDLVKILATFESRSVFDIIDDISQFYADIVKVRVVHKDVDKGAIPVDDGILLIQKAKELISSISLSSLDKKKHYSGSKPENISDFLSNLLLGQTEHGSFIVNIISPIEQELESSLKFKESTSFTRIVSTNLATGLDAITTAVKEYEETGNINVFDESVDKGVSANLCDALIGLSGKKKHREFSISLKLSGSELNKDNIPLVHNFYPDMIPVLEKVSKRFKENYIIPGYKLGGYVKKLEQEVTNDVGSITVVIKLDNKDKPITFELDSSEYLEAIHAHENKAYIECCGDLHVSPRSGRLVDIYDFKVLNNGELF